MALVLDTVVIGLQLGALYALVAVGIALVYKATRVLNFAHGEIGTSAAFLAWILLVGGDIAEGRAQAGWLLVPATLLAILVGIVLSVGVGGIISRLKERSEVTGLVVTVAVTLFLLGAQLTAIGVRSPSFPRYIGGAPCLERVGGECVRPFVIGTIIVSWHTIVIVAVLAAAAALLALYFRTRAGTALLATAQDPLAAELQGVSVRGMRLIAWGTAGGLAAIAALLGAGVFEQISPGLMLTTFLLPGFAGALLGGMTSMAGAALGGLLLGVLAAGANQVVQTFDIPLPGPPQTVVLVVLLVVLLVRPQGLLGRAA